MSKQIKIYGAIDPHTHLRDLDWSHKATFASETAAAVAGGYWAVFDMPNTAPSTITTERLKQKRLCIDQTAHCDWGLYFGASQADNTAEYASAATLSCGLKIFNNSTTGDLLIDNQPARDHHIAHWPAGHMIAVHAEEETVLDILELVRKHRKPTHFLHISTRAEIDYLTAAKEEGLPVTIGVCPHHLYLTEADLATLGGFGMMKPPLKSQDDVSALWDAIRAGIVDVIESDHAPHTYAEKTGDQPAYGVPGLETTIPLMMTAVHEGRVDLERVIAMLSTNTHRIWNLTCPPDTYTVIDLDTQYTIRNDQLHTQCGWSPFDGMTVCGKVIETWIRGQRVYDGESVLNSAGFGQSLFS